MHREIIVLLKYKFMAIISSFVINTKQMEAIEGQTDRKIEGGRDG